MLNHEFFYISKNSPTFTTHYDQVQMQLETLASMDDLLTGMITLTIDLHNQIENELFWDSLMLQYAMKATNTMLFEVKDKANV